MKVRSLRTMVMATPFLIGMGLASNANASFVIDATVGGAATGVTYANFDNLPLGSLGGVSNGITVSFVPDGQTVTGAVSGIYAAPFLSNSNGVPFGDSTVSGADTTKYLTTGLGQVSLLFPGMEKYLGLLWGSVDNYNHLEFFAGITSVGTVSGLDIFASANGDRGINGTFYANIVSNLAFDRVVATSSQYAFEFDNVAYNESDPEEVPEPMSLGLLGLGLLGVGVAASRRRKSASVGTEPALFA